MYDRVGGKCVAGCASVIAGMGTGRPFNVQGAVFVRQVRRHVDAPIDIVIDHSAVVIPEYIHGIHRTLSNHALQVQRAVKHQILLGSTGYFGLRFCEQTKNKHIVISD